MDDREGLARRFDEQRAHLRAVAYRMLGSPSEADDAVQEAWLKLSRTDEREVENLGGFLTTIVARVCLDMLRSRRSRREEPLAPVAEAEGADSPEADVAFADALGPALLVVLEMLAPAERVAFVLHDMFDLSFEEIAPIVDRTPEATRQLASRGRRRVRGVPADGADHAQHHALVSAFLSASRHGDFEQLLAVLAPDAVLHADDLAVRTAAANPGGAPHLAAEVHGAALVAGAFKGRARGMSRALIDGKPGAVWATGDVVRVAFLFTIERDRISAIEVVMEPSHLADLDLQLERHRDPVTD